MRQQREELRCRDTRSPNPLSFVVVVTTREHPERAPPIPAKYFSSELVIRIGQSHPVSNVQAQLPDWDRSAIATLGIRPLDRDEGARTTRDSSSDVAACHDAVLRDTHFDDDNDDDDDDALVVNPPTPC